MISDDEIVEIANYIKNNKTTVRAAAKRFGISKSSVYNNITKILPNISISLADDILDILSYNKSVRHIRGGIATSVKWKILHNQLQ